MTRFDVTVEMAVPVEQAFAYLADPRRRPDWQSSLRKVELDEPDAEPAVGTTWREWTVVGVAPHMEITAMEPYRLWAERGTWHGVSAELTLHFTQIPTGTRVHAEAEVTGSGIWSAPASLSARLGASAARQDLRRAARLLAAQ